MDTASERLEALDRPLECYREYRGRLVFFQAGVPSRTRVEEYRRLQEQLDERFAQINWIYGRGDWQRLIFVREHLDLPTPLALDWVARVKVVSSLHEGINLVAKEFVAAQVDGNGVLLLSQFTGAAGELAE